MKCEHLGLRMAFGHVVTEDNRQLCTSCALDEPVDKLVSAVGAEASKFLKRRRDNE